MTSPAPRSGATLRDYLKSLPTWILPARAAAALMHRATRSRSQAWKNLLIRMFIRHYRVDLSDAVHQQPQDFTDFNSFFTRALRPGARPLCAEPTAVACPVDGFVGQIGNLRKGRIVQAKGRDYSVQDLMGGDASRAAPFLDGSFANLYLSPRDYHRVHMPIAGELREMVYVPGRLFSVGPHTTRAVPGLFARNERVLCGFQTDLGPMQLVLVGAFFVGSIETVWAGTITPPHGRAPRVWRYPEGTRALARGAEVGRFNMGSTVILLFGRHRVAWDPVLEPGAMVRVGRRLGMAIERCR